MLTSDLDESTANLLHKISYKCHMNDEECLAFSIVARSKIMSLENACLVGKGKNLLTLAYPTGFLVTK
jgi:hypothetical protein